MYELTNNAKLLQKAGLSTDWRLCKSHKLYYELSSGSAKWKCFLVVVIRDFDCLIVTEIYDCCRNISMFCARCVCLYICMCVRVYVYIVTIAKYTWCINNRCSSCKAVSTSFKVNIFFIAAYSTRQEEQTPQSSNNI
jgi:hypothetical protein